MFKFHFTWENDEIGGSPEDVATWARIGLEICGEQVFYHQDLLSGEKRNCQLLPLIDLANWFAGNYWFLLGESQNEDRLEEFDYVHRHTFCYASQGFPLPLLTIYSEKEFIRLKWEVREEIQAQIKYLKHNSAKIAVEEFRSELNLFLESVHKQLLLKEISNTEFQDLWLAIKAAGDDEAEFCLAAAAIGKDPYEIDDAKANEIVEASKILPNDLYFEFLNAVGRGFSLVKAKKIQQWINKLSNSRDDQYSKPAKRNRPKSLIKHSEKPWEDGYIAARDMRKRLKMKINEPIIYADLMDRFGLEMEDPMTREYLDLNGATEKIDVLITSDSDKRASLIFGKRFKESHSNFRELNEKFAFCRAIFEFEYHQKQSALVTSTYLSSQKRNRAFAAEFLAPAEEIKKQIGNNAWIAEEKVQIIADKLMVANFIVRHQIENNGLARIKSQF